MVKVGIFTLVTGIAGPSGFGSSSTAEQVTEGVDASKITAIITGGASGIGLETARVLALRNAHVVIAARNMEAANEAKHLILEDNKAASVDVLQLDLNSIKSIRAFVNSFEDLNLPLNLLINNAGVMFCPYQLSKDGIEMQFATNHLGHFLLTNLLLDKMKATAKATGIEGRIVNLSSVAHLHTYEGGIVFENINDRNSYCEKKAYGQSKLANILHANELSRRLQDEGANITVNSVHPGLIMTNLMRHSALLMRILKFFTCLLWKNVPQGAATTCYVAFHPKLKGVTGKYFADCNEFPPSKLATDESLAKKLWDFSNKNNAGVMFCPYQLSKDGIEMQFATNHLGHFLLTNLLLDKMKATAKATGIEGRIVNLSSVAHLHTYEGGIVFKNINDRNSYCEKKAYGQSKLANILHANELSRRLQDEGANITVNSVHPGLIMTNLMRHSALLMSMNFEVFHLPPMEECPTGAATTCYVAFHPKLKGVTGKYFADCNEFPPSKLATDESLAKKLWDFSNKLVNAAEANH